MLSSAKIGRSSWRYYQDSVARGACEYYAEGGNAPGRWHGAGLPELGLTAGAEVDERELEALFARGLHPATGAALGRAWRSDAVTGHDLTFSAPKSVSALWALADDATAAQVRAAHTEAVSAALGFLEAHASFSRRGRNGVEQIGSAGYAAALFEHTTSRTGDPQLHTHTLVVNKVRCSDGVWRTIDGYEVFHHKKAAGALYQAALRAELGTRLGMVFGPVSEHGQAEIAGVPDELLVAWSTRTAAVMADAVPTLASAEEALGRPVTAAERARIVKTAVLATRPPKDDHMPAIVLRARWRDQAAALGWTATRLQATLRRPRLAAVVESVTDSVTPSDAHGPVAGTGNGSTVAAAVTAVTTPDDRELSTVVTVTESVTTVTAAVATVTESVTNQGADAAGAELSVSARRQQPGEVIDAPIGPGVGLDDDPLAVLTDAVTAVGRTGAIWSAADLTVHIAARLPAIGTGSPRNGHEAAVMIEALTARALTDAAAGAVGLGADPSGATARASDARFALREVVETEAEIIEAVLDGLRPPRRLPATVLQPILERGLSAEQQVAAVRLVSSRDLVTVMVAPAGAGKTTVLGAAVAGWSAAGERVLALGPSARAATELATASGRSGATVARFLTQQAALDEPQSRNAVRGLDESRLRRGDVVLVDEASMLATADLTALSTRAAAVGARLVLVGDPAQIGAIRAPGGMLEHLTGLVPARVVELEGLHRFAHAWEAAATLALRAGDPEVLRVYAARGRIHPAATSDDAADAVFGRWHQAITDGRDALMLARGWSDVTALNARARAVAIATGQVTGPALLMVTARTASTRGRPEVRDWRAGDVIMAKKNTPALHVGVDSVRNGDRFQVLAASHDGSGLVVADLAGRGTTTLPAAYLARHTEYGWAATIDAAQGATTDVAVTLARSGMDREHVYVAMTRGRWANHIHTTPETAAVDAGPHPPPAPSAARAARPIPHADPRDDQRAGSQPSASLDGAEAIEQLARALATTGRERAAHSLLAPAVDDARAALFDAAEAGQPAPPMPVARRRADQRLSEALADRDRQRIRLESLRAEMARLAGEIDGLPVWSRGRRRELATELATALQSVEAASEWVTRAETGVTTAAGVVDAHTREQQATALSKSQDRRSRWERRTDQPYRNPNLVGDPDDPTTVVVREQVPARRDREADSRDRQRQLRLPRGHEPLGR